MRFTMKRPTREAGWVTTPISFLVLFTTLPVLGYFIVNWFDRHCAPTQFIAGSCVATWHASAIDVTIYGITFVLSLLLVIVPSAMPLPERKSPPWLHSASGRSC